MRLGFVGVICAVMLHTANKVHADEKPWRLEYRRGPEAPSNCPDESYLRTALAAKNGSPEPFSDNASRTITIKIIPTAERIEARIHARDEQGSVVSEQIAHAPTFRCDQLADRIVFVLHDIIDPVKLPEPEATQSPISSTTSAVSDKPTTDVQEPTTTAENPTVLEQETQKTKGTTLSKPRMALSLSLGATWWSAPHTAFTSALGIGARWPKFFFGIEGKYDRAWELPANQSVRIELLGLGVAGCGYHDFRNSRFYVRGCLFGDLSQLSTQVTQVRDIESATFAFHIGVRAGAGFSLTQRWSIELNADGTVAIQQPRFVFNELEDWRLPRFNGALRASVVGLFNVF